MENLVNKKGAGKGGEREKNAQDWRQAGSLRNPKHRGKKDGQEIGNEAGQAQDGKPMKSTIG